MKGNCGECSNRWVCDIDPNECDMWPDPAPMTNADRIRAMSDEELADILDSFSACSRCPKLGDSCFLAHDTLEWLQQPVKEGA